MRFKPTEDGRLVWDPTGCSATDVKFDGDGCPRGVTFCRLEADHEPPHQNHEGHEWYGVHGEARLTGALIDQIETEGLD